MLKELNDECPEEDGDHHQNEDGGSEVYAGAVRSYWCFGVPALVAFFSSTVLVR